MTVSDTAWRQLRDVVGGVLKVIEPKPTPAGTVTRQGKTAERREPARSEGH